MYNRKKTGQRGGSVCAAAAVYFLRVCVMNAMTSAAPQLPTGTVAPGPRGTACTLDAYREEDVDQFLTSLRQALKQNLGVTDADIDTVLAQAGGNVGSGLSYTGARMFGDVSQCAAVKANRVAGIVEVGVLALVAAVTVYLMLKGGKSTGLYRALQMLSLAGTAITVFQLRHTANLTGKILWYGSGANTRRMLMLTVAGMMLSVALHSAKDAATAKVVVPLLGAMAGVTLTKLYFTVRSMQSPEGAHLVAFVSALDRMISNKKIKAAQGLLAKRATQPPGK